MSRHEIQARKLAFDQADHLLEGSDIEYCLARELMILLGYDRWKNFNNELSKAKVACENSKMELTDHFRGITKMVSGVRPSLEIVFAHCPKNLVALNADATKPTLIFNGSSS